MERFMKKNASQIYDRESVEQILMALIKNMISTFGRSGKIFKDYENIKMFNLGIQDVRGEDINVDFYIRAKKDSDWSSAQALVPEENNGKPGIVMLFDKDMTMKDFIKEIDTEDFFQDVYSRIAHELTHIMEMMAKPKIYSHEEEERLRKVREEKGDEEYQKVYGDAEVEFESLLTSMISFVDSNFVQKLIQRKNDKSFLEHIIKKCQSGEMFKYLLVYVNKGINLYAKKGNWNEKKKKRAYRKAYLGVNEVVEGMLWKAKNLLEQNA
jgi:hypothetical protein